jgi:phytoene synthase
MSRAAELRAILAQGSKSFSLASHLLPAESRDAAAAVYAFCRRCDDAIDEVPRARQPEALARLRDELDAVYGGATPDDLVLAAFQDVVLAQRIPREYPADLIEGMATDVEGRRYRDLREVSLYAYRVAGTVGLMMCHVMGVKHDAALTHAVHLGIALQLTNIARDVAEDWDRGRVYLPDELLGQRDADALHAALGGPMPGALVDRVAGATTRLLAIADEHYRTADEGLRFLSLRHALAIRSARWIYWGIGERVAARRGDPRRGRAVVPLGDKLRLVSRAMVMELAAAPKRLLEPHGVRLPCGLGSFAAAESAAQGRSP